eukprot:CAMPEP_0175133668 /NCGR_PEP_ID=MMETSP0087-20121206/7771_1 /TAXON_ID=136419 /ORGANISM="Unknown Unknown, Strain D1" /LENGTH=385 /DNA_ID=CAMNT_0016416185 /DNA_START=35 /DNA_END=1193 /DNA_ORIENTATION=+
MRSLILGFLVPVLAAKYQLVEGESSSDDAVTRIAFGSCNKQNFPQPLWPDIVTTRPDIWIWLGDAIYADYRNLANPVTRFSSLPIPDIQAKYAVQKEHTGYQELVSSVKGVLGVWDDHDFGINDGDHTYVNKSLVQQIFLDFLDEGQDSNRRKREGLYGAWSFGDATKQQKLTVILLDNRYFNGEEGDILGSAQWGWLADTIDKHSDSQLFLVGAGLQILPTDRPAGESFNRVGNSRSRLLQLLQDKGIAQRVVLLSGDVHFGELTCVNLPGQDRPLVEITSSGLSHAWGSGVHYWPVSFLTNSLLLPLLPARYHVQSPTPATYGDLNFGLISVDWQGEEVKLELVGAGGVAVLRAVDHLAAAEHALILSAAAIAETKIHFTTPM